MLGYVQGAKERHTEDRWGRLPCHMSPNTQVRGLQHSLLKPNRLEFLKQASDSSPAQCSLVEWKLEWTCDQLQTEHFYMFPNIFNT